MPARLITAATEIPCPVCRRQNLSFAESVGAWTFTCGRCRAAAKLTQQEINRSDQDGDFAERLRAALVASMGRGGRGLGVRDEGPELRVRPEATPRPGSRRATRVPGLQQAPPPVPRPAPVRLKPRPLSRRMRRLQDARRRLNEVQQQLDEPTPPEDPESP